MESIYLVIFMLAMNQVGVPYWLSIPLFFIYKIVCVFIKAIKDTPTKT